MIQVFCGSHQKPQYMTVTVNQVVRSLNLLTVTSLGEIAVSAPHSRS